ncbi:hypothetical protein [Demequina globuliformis]|uniref:hypothetical protein n=1 Tax=Demequina globuliformis TaxID=676202 RepID=UPI0007820571|nr:hypothetical protein [Demequina globuliformis]
MTSHDGGQDENDGGEVQRSVRMTRAWELSSRRLTSRSHTWCVPEIADKRAAVRLVREELACETPDPFAQSDFTALLHNLIAALFTHQDCDKDNVAEALGLVDEYVDRSARLFTEAIAGNLSERDAAIERSILASAVELRSEVRDIAGVHDPWDA